MHIIQCFQSERSIKNQPSAFIATKVHNRYIRWWCKIFFYKIADTTHATEVIIIYKLWMLLIVGRCAHACRCATSLKFTRFRIVRWRSYWTKRLQNVLYCNVEHVLYISTFLSVVAVGIGPLRLEIHKHKAHIVLSKLPFVSDKYKEFNICSELSTYEDSSAI